MDKPRELSDICTQPVNKQIDNAKNKINSLNYSKDDLYKILKEDDKKFELFPDFRVKLMGNDYCKINPISNNVECKYRADNNDDNGLYMCLYDDINKLNIVK